MTAKRFDWEEKRKQDTCDKHEDLVVGQARIETRLNVWGSVLGALMIIGMAVIGFYAQSARELTKCVNELNTTVFVSQRQIEINTVRLDNLEEWRNDAARKMTSLGDKPFWKSLGKK